MKKIISLIIIIVIIATAFCACNNNNSEPVEQTNLEVDITLFPELETSSENLDMYRQEVSMRLDSLYKTEYFLTEDEWNIITTLWPKSKNLLDRFSIGFSKLDYLYKECNEYYYPVVYREGESLILWYTDSHGSVLLKEVYGNWNGSNYIGQLHSDSEDQAIASEINYTFTYKPETGVVSMWELNEEVETFKLPQNSVYCGFSDFEGHIFRSGTDVYALQTDRINTADGWSTYWKVICIAHNVKYVIDSDYRAASDPWSQPLFLMVDGTVKVYVRWEGDYQDIRDHESHLVDLYYEGGIGV